MLTYMHTYIHILANYLVSIWPRVGRAADSDSGESGDHRGEEPLSPGPRRKLRNQRGKHCVCMHVYVCMYVCIMMYNDMCTFE